MINMDRLCKDCQDGESANDFCHTCIKDDNKPNWIPRKQTSQRILGGSIYKKRYTRASICDTFK